MSVWDWSCQLVRPACIRSQRLFSHEHEISRKNKSPPSIGHERTRPGKLSLLTAYNFHFHGKTNLNYKFLLLESILSDKKNEFFVAFPPVNFCDRSISRIYDLPIWHKSPVHCGGHWHWKPPIRSIHVPPCSQGPPEHSSMSIRFVDYLPARNEGTDDAM